MKCHRGVKRGLFSVNYHVNRICPHRIASLGNQQGFRRSLLLAFALTILVKDMDSLKPFGIQSNTYEPIASNIIMILVVQDVVNELGHILFLCSRCNENERSVVD